jgi:hypothetical protein
MVINEKALEAQMKEAYKNGGYRVLVSGSRMVFSNGYWLASIDKDNVPSKLLGMLAEHIRAVPISGQAYRVYKTKEGTIAQSAILEDAIKPWQNMQEQRDEAWDEPNPPMMLPTPLTYNGMQLWQSLPGNDIYMIDPRFAVMISQKAEDVWKVGNGLYVQGEISELWVLRSVDGQAVEQIKHLEAIAWAKK